MVPSYFRFAARLQSQPPAIMFLKRLTSYTRLFYILVMKAFLVYYTSKGGI